MTSYMSNFSGFIGINSVTEQNVLTIKELVYIDSDHQPPATSSKEVLMQINEQQTRVTGGFNINPKELINEKFKEGKLYNLEIARMLNAGTPVNKRVGKVRKKGRPDYFLEKFEKKYGPGSIAVFRNIIEDPYAALADAGRRFGFSREYARILCDKIYGFPYSEILVRKKVIKKTPVQKTKAKLKAKQLFFMPGVVEMVKIMGFNLETPIKGSFRNILINGHNINVKVASGSNSRFFSISLTKLKRKDCDFFICICRGNWNNDAHYIIPYDAMPKNGASIPINPKQSKYFQFRDAWHLLEQKRER